MTCSLCGGREHRIMEICPAKPGLLELWRKWFADDSHDPMVWIAVAGTCMLLPLLVISTILLFVH